MTVINMDDYKYSWILTPNIDGIDFNKLHEYGCYDDRCLISTFFIDEMLDCLDDLHIKHDYFKCINDNY
jgi:hypothetical protein